MFTKENKTGEARYLGAEVF